MEKFYKVTDRQEGNGEWLYRVRMNAEHPIYQAHFPGYPITPGAMLMQMALELINLSEDTAQELTNARNVKFLKPHQPQATPALIVRIGKSQDSYSVVIEEEGILFAKMMLETAECQHSKASEK
ncbi:MAG: hypothetical protein IJP70_06200 [Bacteroidales bacterium]|nr:hypothetical protein [Bacteroidales bacterium]